MVWDTAREKEIDLAPGYPYEPLADGECLVPLAYKHDMAVGDNITFKLQVQALWGWIVSAYNERAADSGWRGVPASGWYEMEFNCTVKDFMSSTYGKMATDNSER